MNIFCQASKPLAVSQHVADRGSGCRASGRVQIHRHLQYTGHARGTEGSTMFAGRSGSPCWLNTLIARDRASSGGNIRQQVIERRRERI